MRRRPGAFPGYAPCRGRPRICRERGRSDGVVGRHDGERRRRHGGQTGVTDRGDCEGSGPTGREGARPRVSPDHLRTRVHRRGEPRPAAPARARAQAFPLRCASSPWGSKAWIASSPASRFTECTSARSPSLRWRATRSIRGCDQCTLRNRESSRQCANYRSLSRNRRKIKRTDVRHGLPTGLATSQTVTAARGRRSAVAFLSRAG